MNCNIKKAIQNLVIFAFAILCVVNFNINAKADLVEDKANGVEYNDNIDISIGYASSHNYGGGNYSTVYLSDGNRVMNVKSSSKNLVAVKTREYTSTTTDKDYDTDQMVTKTTYGTTHISFFAKKKGTYKVTFDVVGSDGAVKCTKTITVKTYGNAGYVNPVKSVTYAGKDIYYYYPYTTRTSGKFSIKFNKGFKLVSVEVGKRDSKGEIVYKKVKNNKTIKLAKKEKYSIEYSYSKYDCNPLFPQTFIRVTYKENKTGDIDTLNYSLYTLNKK